MLKILKNIFSRKDDSNFFHEYWIGKDINLNKYWEAYINGKNYMEKFSYMNCYVLEITFEKPSKELPLFNLEPIYKTTKSYYHDIKRDCLTINEYNSAGPIFIYEINRSSGIWTWLGEIKYLLLLATSLAEEKIKGQRIDNIEKKLKILKENFGDGSVQPELFDSFMNANTSRELDQAVQYLLDEKIKSIKISKSPFNRNIEDSRKGMIDIKAITNIRKDNN